MFIFCIIGTINVPSKCKAAHLGMWDRGFQAYEWFNLCNNTSKYPMWTIEPLKKFSKKEMYKIGPVAAAGKRRGGKVSLSRRTRPKIHKEKLLARKMRLWEALSCLKNLSPTSLPSCSRDFLNFLLNGLVYLRKIHQFSCAF